MVEELLAMGHDVTIATRGNAADSFGNKVKRIQVERTDAKSMKKTFAGKYYDVVVDKIAYCSNDIKYAMDALDFDKGRLDLWTGGLLYRGGLRRAFFITIYK